MGAGSETNGGTMGGWDWMLAMMVTIACFGLIATVAYRKRGKKHRE